ncbi:MAG: hypothetical protein HY675_13080 [Chloroflexi bacterium]|nr:hypothetical protein [Chloroflexota bacterium]
MRRPAYNRTDFDHFARVLIGRWEFAVELQARWESFDGEQHAVLTEDWPVNNDIHQNLADYVAGHELTEDQEAQWSKLNKLVAEHTEALRKMGYRVRIPKVGKERAVA